VHPASSLDSGTSHSSVQNSTPSETVCSSATQCTSKTSSAETSCSAVLKLRTSLLCTIFLEPHASLVPQKPRTLPVSLKLQSLLCCTLRTEQWLSTPGSCTLTSLTEKHTQKSTEPRLQTLKQTSTCGSKYQSNKQLFTTL